MQRSGSRLPWIVGIVAIALLTLFAAILYTKYSGHSGSRTASKGSATAPTPEPAPPSPRLPTPAPAPVPAPAPSSRALPLAQVADLAGKGRPQEKLVLVGELKVVSARPPTTPGTAPGAILRPADARLSGTMRVLATFPVGSALPQEGSVVRWDESSRFLIRDVVRGEDGQINVSVQPDAR